MKVVTLIENTAPKGLLAEWGLSLYIEYGGKKYLLDTGASDKFLKNAKTLGVNIAAVDKGVLSHAHFDHADGMDAFFAANVTAPFYIRACTQENCYGRTLFLRRYIGIPRGILQRQESRLVRAEGDTTLDEGVWLIPHKTSGLSAIGKAARMSVRENGTYRPDDFAHEQSLVFSCAEGLVVLNSCSHGRADNILREVRRTFPDKHIHAYIGGLHLCASSGAYIAHYGETLAQMDTDEFYTGHCTGARAYGILKKSLGDRLHPITTGSVLEFAEKE
jgi:7,8-dihydropterin-6-yl-methyl-4-(beta-D-ribofuranosyl)aminobenzene 5'-phosphate synthase